MYDDNNINVPTVSVKQLYWLLKSMANMCYVIASQLTLF